MNDGAHDPSETSAPRNDANWLWEFEQSWRQGNRIRIESFLVRAPVEQRRALLRDLLKLELQLRRAAGEDPQLDEYRRRFPHEVDVLLAAFSTRRSTEPPGETVVITRDAVHPSDPGSRSAPHSAKLADEWSMPERMGRFILREVLGHGAFGIVYLADDPQLERPVALKVPRADRFDSATDAERFIQEARNVAKLSHPGIVQVYDVALEGETPFIVQQYIDGGSLSTRMKDGPLPPAESAAWMIAIAEAMAYAHERGFVHRDLKPDNILIDRNGQPCVADFGLALHETVQHRRRGERSGTPAFMSPEQMRGLTHQLDGRSDIWSLGCMLYAMLTGRRPFMASSREELFEEITSRDPRPIRQLNRSVPQELERICLRCLNKRMSDRYPTANDLAADLMHWRDQLSSGTIATVRSVPPPEAPLVPQGLRSFGEADTDFFPRLLPGPRDRDGLPESIRFWKHLVEETCPEKTFRVGVMYGPSGCGKSSLMKAGILPRVASHVVPVYLETTRHDTNERLLIALRRRYPALFANLDLADAAALLREQTTVGGGKKTLIVLDQFEQWLHARHGHTSNSLVEALRHCDGEHLQCVLLVRDDFWMSITRLMQELDLPLVERANSMAVDLFDRDHARHVLAAFGQAYGRIACENLSAEEEQFLDQAVDSLVKEDKVVCVRLALFAEMMKSRPWTPGSLRVVGGAEGVGVTFLEQTLGASTAPLSHRYHQRAARAVLKSLLPERTANIKGQTRCYSELREVAGYGEREHEFRELLDILDNQVRLITPTETSDAETLEVETPGTGKAAYQLTHDYLVPSLRDWLTRKQRETHRGRAELRLQERTEIWVAKPENRHLPKWWEDLDVRLFTSRRQWSPDQVRMMRKSAWYHRLRLGMVLICFALMITAGLAARRYLDRQQHQNRARALVQSLLTADITQVPDLIDAIERDWTWAGPFLLSEHAKAPDDSSRKLHTALALAPRDAAQLAYIQRRLLEAPPDEVRTICALLLTNADELEASLRAVLEQADSHTGSQRLRAAAALAAFDPSDALWPAVSKDVVSQLLEVPTTQRSDWIRMLRAVKRPLMPHLITIYRDERQSAVVRKSATDVLADYAADDPQLLVDLIVEADPHQFAVLLDPLLQNSRATTPFLQSRLESPLETRWPDEAGDAPDPSADTVQAVQEAYGLVTPGFACCLTMQLAAWEEAVTALHNSGYRLTHLRPYATPGGTCVAAVWLRDGRACRWTHGCSLEQLRKTNAEWQVEGFFPADVAAYAEWAEKGAGECFAAVWVQGNPGVSDPALFDRMRGALYAGVAEGSHAGYWEPLNEAGFVPRSNCRTWDADRSPLYSSVRWKLRINPVYRDCWDVQQGDYENLQPAGWFQADVRLSEPRSAEETPRFAAVWWNGVRYESRELHGLDPLRHREQSEALANAHYRPSSLSVICDRRRSELSCASTWYRPAISEARRDRWARQRANAAVALLQLSAGDAVWSLLEQQPDPSVRSYLVQNLGELGVDPLVLLRRIAIEPDASVLRALVLALAAVDRSRVPPVARDHFRQRVAQLLQRGDDPGLYSSLELLLRRWELPEVRDDVLPAPSEDGSCWYRTTAGQVMSVLDPPREMIIGSPSYEDERDHYREVERTVSLGYRYAISTTEVTVEQFLQFDAGFDYAVKFSPEEDCPINMVTWYDAARYCNWLSQREGIPREEWCFPDVIKPGMQVPADYLRRTGFRLPTEAEWEFACRAGTTTSRYFGDSAALLKDYDWTVTYSQNRTWPVALLTPNDFGLFDVLGNVMEWCCPLHDLSDSDFAVGAIDDNVYAIARGGAYDFQASSARSAYRYVCVPSERQPYVGFRIVRTMPAE